MVYYPTVESYKKKREELNKRYVEAAETIQKDIRKGIDQFVAILEELADDDHENFDGIEMTLYDMLQQDHLPYLQKVADGASADIKEFLYVRPIAALRLKFAGVKYN
jgi:hypothetical protein